MCVRSTRKMSKFYIETQDPARFKPSHVVHTSVSTTETFSEIFYSQASGVKDTPLWCLSLSCESKTSISWANCSSPRDSWGAQNPSTTELHQLQTWSTNSQRIYRRQDRNKTLSLPCHGLQINHVITFFIKETGKRDLTAFPKEEEIRTLSSAEHLQFPTSQNP